MSTTVQPESQFLTINGLRLHYLDWGNPSAPPLLAVHGFRGNAHAFDGFARRFQNRYHIIAPDVRGRGQSAWSPEGAYQLTDYVTDMEGIVDQLGLDRFTLVGTSMGGRISMLYAREHAGRLEGLVLNDIGPDNETGSARITQEAASTPDAFTSLDEAMTYMVKIAPGRASLSAAELREAALASYREEAPGRWVARLDPAILQQRAATGAAATAPLWPVLEGMSCPTLVVWGMESDVLSEQQARRMVAALPRGELVAVPGVGHAPTLMEPAAFTALERFLTSPE